jgi:heptosyltransferase I
LCEHKPINLIGQTNLKQLLAIIKGARGVIAPDSGPAHMATAVSTPVIGLYACTNPDRARPYLSGDYVVNRYPEAVQAKYGVSVDDVPWGSRVREPDTMARIKIDDVIVKLDKLLSAP